jgi:DNA-directed RNA polymerase beta subunit
MNSRIYDLGLLGRLNLNKRINSEHFSIYSYDNYSILQSSTHIRKQDLNLSLAIRKQVANTSKVSSNNANAETLSMIKQKDLSDFRRTGEGRSSQINNWIQNQTTLTGQDILLIFNELIKIYYGDQIIDDIDDLKNRRLRTAGELIQTQFATGLIRLEKFINEQIRQSCGLVSKETKDNFLHNNIQSMNNLTLFDSLELNKIDDTKKFFCLKHKLHNLSNDINTVPTNFNENFKINKITIPSLEKLFNIKPINGAFQEFFGLNPLSQFMDQTNPLAEITHKRRLTSLGPGGVERETAGMAIRGIHPTHYGRICPIETPEGQNAGLVNSITTYGYANEYGYIKTPCYKIYKGQIQRELGPFFLFSEQEKNFSVVPGDIFLNSVDILPGSQKKKLSNKTTTSLYEKSPELGFFWQSHIENSKLSVAFGCDAYQIANTNSCSANKEKAKSRGLKRVHINHQTKNSQIPIRHNYEFKRVFRDTVHYMIISPIQMISIATSLIPFLEHDDANRALMGSNMQRQAVPLLYATRPIVGTGLEARSISDSGQSKLAMVSGLIYYVSSNKVSIYTSYC